MTDLKTRIELAAHIMGLEYPGYSGVWLKAMSTADVSGVDRRDRRALLRSLLADHFYDWTPEHAPYSQLVTDVPRRGGAPAFIGIDDEIVAILWAP